MDNATSGRTRYELLPPDLTDLDIYKPYWHPDASKAERREASRNVHKRLSFDLALEFGQRADLPRSLALTGALSAFVDLPKGVALSAAAEALYAIEVPTLDIEDENLRLRWVQGALELLRARGASTMSGLAPTCAPMATPICLTAAKPALRAFPVLSAVVHLNSHV